MVKKVNNAKKNSKYNSDNDSDSDNDSSNMSDKCEEKSNHNTENESDKDEKSESKMENEDNGDSENEDSNGSNGGMEENISKDDDEIEVDDNEVLKKNVSTYIKIDDLIREKKEELKELMAKKCECEEFIASYFEKNGKTKIETNDGEIVFKKTSSKTPLKEEQVEKAIVNKFHDVKKITESGIKIAHDIIEEVNNMRDTKVKTNVRRIKKNGRGKK